MDLTILPFKQKLTYKILQDLKIDSVESLMECSANDLIKFRNIGKTRVFDINRALVYSGMPPLKDIDSFLKTIEEEKNRLELYYQEQKKKRDIRRELMKQERLHNRRIEIPFMISKLKHQIAELEDELKIFNEQWT